MFKVTIATVALCCSLLAADAPMFRGDAAHTGVYASASAPALESLRWKFKTNGKVISVSRGCGWNRIFRQAPTADCMPWIPLREPPAGPLPRAVQ